MFLNKNNYTRRMQMLLLALFTASLTVVLHSIGTDRAWYWTYRWFDVVTHLLGGFSLGLLVILLYKKIKKHTLPTLATVLVLIIGWEVFEVLFAGVATKDLWYSVGTLKDIVVGLSGAYMAILLCNKNNRTTPTTP